MLNFKPPYLIGLTAAGLVIGGGVIAATAMAGDGPKIEKRDITLHIAPPAFADIDANKDGTISKAEFDAFHAQHKPPVDGDDDMPPPPGGKRMRMMIMGEDLDANKDGKVTFQEFSAPVKAHFDALDANKDGVLDAGEQPKGHKGGHRPRD